ncbi:MAG: hypothetical protein ABEI77_05715 [Halorientalis sp.]
MSSPHSRQVRSPPATDENAPPPTTRKAVLFCPDCDYQAEVDGGWTERDDRTARVRKLQCPECATVVTARPLPEDSVATQSGHSRFVADSVDALGTLWVSTVRFWIDALGPAAGLQRAN